MPPEHSDPVLAFHTNQPVGTIQLSLIAYELAAAGDGGDPAEYMPSPSPLGSCEEGYPVNSKLSFCTTSSRYENSDDHPVLKLDEDNGRHQRRLAEYFLRLTVMSLVLMVATCSLHCLAPHLTWLLGVLAALCFAMATTAMVITSKPPATEAMALQPRGVDRLCVAVYASTGLLMVGPFALLLILDTHAAVVLVPLLPVGAVIVLLLRKGEVLGFAWGSAHYWSHDDDLRCLFRLAAGVTTPTYAGLLVLLLRKLAAGVGHHRRLEVIGAVDCLLLYAVVAGLVLMLLASSPPALHFDVTRAVVVDRFLGGLADVQLALVGLAGLTAAAEVAGMFAVLAFTMHIGVACAAFAREHEDEPYHRGEHDWKRHHVSSGSPPGTPLLFVTSAAFMVLMASYATFAGADEARRRTTVGWRKKGCLTMSVSLLIGGLGQMAIRRRPARTESVASAVQMFAKAYNTLLTVALIFSISVFLVDPAKMLVSMQELLVG